jgi:hypothetical protein
MDGCGIFSRWLVGWLVGRAGGVVIEKRVSVNTNDFDWLVSSVLVVV